MSAAWLCQGAGRVEAQTVGRGSGPLEVASDPVEIEAFRADLTKFVEEMKAVADAASLPSDLNVTLQELPALTGTDLEVLQTAFARSPKWRTLPRTLKSLIRHRSRGVLVPRTRAVPQITADDCPAARSWGYTQTDIEIAADAALAADAILEAVPQDLLSAGVRAAAVAVWAVPQGVLRGFEHLYNIAQACNAADFESGVNTKLDSILGDLATLKDGVVEINHRLLVVQAVQKQIIRLELTPEGRRAVNPEVLTCTGDDCPNVLACPGDECSFPIK
jgi:hypothetical protein